MNKLNISTEQMASLRELGSKLNVTPARPGTRESLLTAGQCSCHGGCADTCAYGCFGGGRHGSSNTFENT